MTTTIEEIRKHAERWWTRLLNVSEASVLGQKAPAEAMRVVPPEMTGLSPRAI